MKITLTELRQMVRNIINESRFKTKFPFKTELEFNYKGKTFEIEGEVWGWDEPIEFSSIKIDGGEDISDYAYNKATSDEDVEELFGMSLDDFEELALEKVKKDDGEARREAEVEHYLSHKFDRDGDY